MNKKLLTVAIGAALAASPMLVGAAGPTVYGKFNVGIASVDNGTEDTLGVTDDSSRLGVKGDEDLGGGLKVIYQMEWQYDADGNGGNQTGRDVYVGFQSSWGSVRVGQYNSSYKAIEFPLEFLGDSIGDFTTNGWSGEGRISNAIGYRSPNFNGFEFGLETSRGETGDNPPAGPSESNPTTVGLTYKAGPLYVGVAMQDTDLQAANGLDDSTKFAISYEFGAFTVYALNESQSAKGTAAEIDTTVFGGVYKWGNNSIVAQLASHEPTTANSDCEQTSLAFLHNFSKTTQGRIIWSSIDNDPAATCEGRITTNAGINMGSTAAPGADVDGFQFQVVKSF